jgi:hypothetical protein
LGQLTRLLGQSESPMSHVWPSHNKPPGLT